MRKFWRLILLIFFPTVTLAIQACAPKHQSQEDCGFVQNVYGERISWKGNVPVPLYIHESVPDEMLSAIQSAVKNWETSAGRPLFRIVADHVSSKSIPQQDGVNMIYLLKDWEKDPKYNSEQARTSVYWVNDEIREADIKLNGRNFTFYVDEPQKSTDVHLESLLVHELGHVLGLKHKDSQGSVMATFLASLTVRTKIGQSDQQDVLCEY